MWDSSSTLLDFDESNSSSRWDHEEIPAFPLPFSAVVSPRLPQRQRSTERQQMIDLMVLRDNAGDEQFQRSQMDESDKISAATPPDVECDTDRPRQLEALKPPRRMSAPTTLPRQKARLARNRIECLVKAQQGSARRLVVREEAGSTGSQRAPQ
jgi:hypothetical protein